MHHGSNRKRERGRDTEIIKNNGRNHPDFDMRNEYKQPRSSMNSE